MIQINKTNNKIILTLTAELDYEDVQDLVLDLQNWLIQNSPAYNEAKEQNHSKNKLAEDMRRCFVDLLDVEAIKKELEVYELDPITKEVIVKNKNLKENGRRKNSSI